MKIELIFKDGHTEECTNIKEGNYSTTYETKSGDYKAVYSHKTIVGGLTVNSRVTVTREWLKYVPGKPLYDGYMVPHWEDCNEISGTITYKYQCPCCGNYKKLDKISEHYESGASYRTFGYHCKECHATFTVDDFNNASPIVFGFDLCAGSRSGGKTIAAENECLKREVENLKRENERLKGEHAIYSKAVAELDGTIEFVKTNTKTTCLNDELKSFRKDYEHIKFTSGVIWNTETVKAVKEAIGLLPYNALKDK